ncbi:ataxin-10 isoform X1 [Polyodon spathula]|uniref:ataxin-10 isoform X1 n=1 Tax=Polyodon spathula TaxID=7913 RepID=UPI001B7F2664|nr:ataxin-10 isoform X1 [Polyodon spathula]XP_041111210.1 ataxin-10 isoform X1 [Polyodon spathula]
MAAPCVVMSELVVKLNKVAESLKLGDFDQSNVMILQNVTKSFREPSCRASAVKAVFQTLLQILSRSLDEIHAFYREDNRRSLDTCLQLTSECFRCQRNACVQCARNQCLMRDLGFIDVTTRILQLLPRLQLVQTDSALEAFRCGIQFLGNLAVGNQDCKDDIWKHTFPDTFLNLLDHSDEKAVAYASMVLFTCLDGEKVGEMLLIEGGLAVAVRLIRLCRKQPELDWAVLIVTQHFLKCAELVEKMYAKLNNQERITLLELITAELGEAGVGTQESAVPVRLAEFLASCFQDKCKVVLTLASDSSAANEEALIVIRLLDILCEMTSDQKKFTFLQSFSELLKTTVELLKEVHLTGKESKNIFTPTHNFSEMETVSHPAVGFKARLIRLTGNLCHNNKENQNKVRELDGIALILDNCSLDGNNPFINQWVVFAIRNVLEQNKQNQEILMAMERRGMADDSALREMGFGVEERDGQLLLKPIKKDT